MWRVFFRHRSNRHADAWVIQRLCAVLILSAAFVASFTASVHGASTCILRGTVRDHITGFPISGANVSLLSTGHASHTNHQGTFKIESLPNGDVSVAVSAIGYRDTSVSSVALRDDLATDIEIRLTPEPIQIDSILVKEDAPKFQSDGTVVLSREFIDASGATQITEVLEHVDGLCLSRGRPGEAVIHVRGGESRHVVVRLDDHPITELATGSANVDIVPLTIVESITIHRGGESALVGSGAIAGVIDISTRSKEVRLARTLGAGYAVGSWQENRSQISLENPIALEGLGYSANWARSGYTGNYPFSYSVEPRPIIYAGERANNGTSSETMAIRLELDEPSAPDLSAMVTYGHETRGLPDKASEQNAFASRKDSRLTGTLSGEFARAGDASLRASVGFSAFDNIFVDTTNASSAEQFHTQTHTRIISGSVHGEILRHALTSLSFVAEGRYDQLEGTDLLRPRLGLGKTTRISTGTAMTFTTSREIENEFLPLTVGLDAATRVDYAQSNSDNSVAEESDTPAQLSPRISGSLGVGRELTLLIRGSYGQSFALPELQSLYWKGDVRSQGNPELRPERAEHSDCAIELSLPLRSFSTHARASFHHSSLVDLVVWEQGQGGVWKPKNLASSRITGSEFSCEMHDASKTIDLAVSHTLTDARNRTPGANSFNRQLTFRPESVTLVKCAVSRGGLRLAYSIRWVGKRYALPDNSRWYEEYRIDDASARYSARLGSGISVTSDLAIENLRDIDYVLIAHYPMPGRSWRAGITLTKTLGLGVSKTYAK